MPEEGFEDLEHSEILRNEEFIELISVFVSMGIKKIRFTGGEPLVRKGFINIIRETKEIAPDLQLAVTTNGVMLGECLDDLHELGVKKINISLDTLLRERFLKLTRRDFLPQVLDNIERVLRYGTFELKLNTVLLHGTLEEIDDFIDYCLQRSLVLRFIEHMPFQTAGASFVSSDILLKELAERGELIRSEEGDSAVAFGYTLNLPARGTVRIGVIPPISHKFCTACNRLRLTANGLLKTCLLSSSEYNIKKSLRDGAREAQLKDIIISALCEKNAGHCLDSKYPDGNSGIKMMSRIGG
jgi:cyclic pyranopterin phosphate synthase